MRIDFTVMTGVGWVVFRLEKRVCGRPGIWCCRRAWYRARYPDCIGGTVRRKVRDSNRDCFTGANGQIGSWVLADHRVWRLERAGVVRDDRSETQAVQYTARLRERHPHEIGHDDGCGIARRLHDSRADRRRLGRHWWWLADSRVDGLEGRRLLGGGVRLRR